MKNKFPLLVLLFASIFYSHAQLIGTYSIGPTSTFKTFTDAVNALANQGFSGHIVFNVDPGVYNEQVTVPDLITSSSQMILFQSKNLDSTSVILKFKPTIDTMNYTLKLDGSDYIIFRKITIESDTITGKVIWMSNDCNYNQFLNNRIIGKYKGQDLVYSDNTSSDNFNYFRQNSFINGSIAINFMGDNTLYETGNLITQNTFTNQYSGAVSLEYEKNIQVTKNLIVSNSDQPSVFGISFNNCSDSFLVLKNKISLTNAGVNSVGIRLIFSDGSASKHNLIANNFVYINATDFAYGIQNICSNMDYLYNSVHITGNYNGSIGMGVIAGTSVKLIDNIFANDADGYALLISDTTGLTSDFNNLFTTGMAVAAWDVNDYPDLISYRNDTKKEVHSVSVNPGFISASDLHTHSPLFDNKGTRQSRVSDDIDNRVRSTTKPDIGAVEFTSSFDIGPDKLLCGNDSLVLDPGAGFDTYLWTGGSTNEKLVVSFKHFGAGTFKIKVTAHYDTLVFRDSVTVTVGAQPLLNLGPDKSICKNSFTWFLAPVGYKYKWSTGDTTQTLIIQVTDTSDYWLTISNAQGCKATDTVRILAIPIPHVNLGKDTVLCAGKSLLLNAGAGFDSCRWFNDSVSHTIRVDTTGRGTGKFNFWVGVTKNGCTVYDSINVTFKICIAVQEINPPEVNIFPNPSSAKFNVRLTPDFVKPEYTILDPTGKILLSGILGQQNTVIDCGKLNDGIYFITIRSKDKNFTEKLYLSR